jgi:hypothetical protein
MHHPVRRSRPPRARHDPHAPCRVWPLVLIAETGPVAERLRVREIDDDKGRRLLRTVRRDSGSVVTCRGADGAAVGARHGRGRDRHGFAFTSEDRVRDIVDNYNAGGSAPSAASARLDGRQPQRH